MSEKPNVIGAPGVPIVALPAEALLIVPGYGPEGGGVSKPTNTWAYDKLAVENPRMKTREEMVAFTGEA